MMLMMHYWPSITSPASQHPQKPLIFTTKWPASFCRSPPPASRLTSPEVTAHATPPHPLYSLRSLKNLKPSLSAGFRDIYPPTPAEERGSAPGITGVGVLTMDAGACESLVARSVLGPRFTGYTDGPERG